MKRIIVSAIAAASLVGAAPASAQLDEVSIKQPGTACITPVTKCVDEAADRAVATVMFYYDYAGEKLKEGVDIGAICRLIWEDGCGTDALPL